MHETQARATFGEWLKQRRKELDLTQEDLAQRIGCSTIAIRKLEAGARRPSKHIATIVADLFQIPGAEIEGFLSFARGLESAQVAPETSPVAPRQSGNLPSRLVRLLGREDAANEIGAYLTQGDLRLLTLTGPPGVGKTSLALEVASRLSPLFRDGAYFVQLATVTDPAGVAAAILPLLGLVDSGRGTHERDLAAYLRDKQVLLVLDNFEQIVEAAPSIVSVLEGSPGTKALVTSREPLHVRGEQVYRVPPLPVPEANETTKEAISHAPSVALFVERASALEPQFALTDADAEAVGAICIHLEGLPLAIELAAARISILTPQEIRAHLESRLTLLSGGPRDLPARQQTLRSAIGWSYALLRDGERSLLARLGVFKGGYTLPAAEAICNARGDLPFDMREGLSSLFDKSLLKRAEVAGVSYFTMLETIREYALEQLEQRGEVDSIRRLHAEYYLTLSEAAEVGLSGPMQPRLLAQLEIEHANIRASLRWAQEKGVGTDADAREALDIGLRIGGAARHFWLLRGYFREGIEDLQGLLALSPSEITLSSYSKGAKAKALGGAGRLAYRQGDYAAARSLFSESLALRREIGDKAGIAWSLTHLGMAELQQSVTTKSDHSTARALQEEGLILHRELGDGWNIALSLEQLGILAYLDRDYSRAADFFSESLALHKEQGQESSIGKLLYQQGVVAYLKKDYPVATALFRESLTSQSGLGYMVGIALNLAALGEVFAETGQPGRGATLLAASDALHRAIGGVMEPSDRLAYDCALDTVRTQIRDNGFERAWQEGQAMSMEQAITLAMAE
jgi:predicted ATPase/transcriptional regulator with XRE-family HTH domain